MSGSNIQRYATPPIQIHYPGTVEEQRGDTSTQSQQTATASSVRLRPGSAANIPALRPYVSPECESLKTLFNWLPLRLDIADCLSDPGVRRCINDQYEDETALCRAADLDNVNAVIRLLEAGADPNVANAKGRTPLLSAASAKETIFEDKIKIIERLLARPEVDVKHSDNDRRNVIHLAAGSAYPEIIELVLKKLEEQGESKEQIREFINARDAKGLTPLFHAACKDTGDHEKTVCLLVKQGADLHVVNESLSNVLHAAVQHDGIYMLKNLLEIGRGDKGFLEWRDKKGNTPLISAASKNQIEMVMAFLNAGADMIGTLLEMIQNNNLNALCSLYIAFMRKYPEEGAGISADNPLRKVFNNPYVAMKLKELAILMAKARGIAPNSGNEWPMFETMAAHNSPTGPCDPVRISDTRISIFLVGIVLQNGPICKLAALANLDFYYATAYCIPNIPLRKNRSGFYLSQLNPYHKTASASSLLEMAKRRGWTMVGEVMRIDYLESAAREIGYEVKTLAPGSLDEFRSQIVEHIGKGIPLMSFFPINSEDDEGVRPNWPCLIKDENTSAREHAALIVGIDMEMDTISLAESSLVSVGIPIADFYRAMGLLPSEKAVEIFEPSKQVRFWDDRNRLNYKKYEQLMPARIKRMTPEERAARRVTPEQPKGSGFRYKVLAMTPDLSHKRWTEQAGNA